MRFSEKVKGDVEFLVIRYEEYGRCQVKFAGGTSKNGETPFVEMLKTLRREVGEEIGDPQLPKHHQVRIMLPDEELRKGLLVEIGKGVDHRQYFYLVSDDELGGVIRQREIWDGSAKLSVPYWASGKALLSSIFRSHIPPLIQALVKACELSEETRRLYARELSERVVFQVAQRS